MTTNEKSTNLTTIYRMEVDPLLQVYKYFLIILFEKYLPIHLNINAFGDLQKKNWLVYGITGTVTDNALLIKLEGKTRLFIFTTKYAHKCVCIFVYLEQPP